MSAIQYFFDSVRQVTPILIQAAIGIRIKKTRQSVWHTFNQKRHRYGVAVVCLLLCIGYVSCEFRFAKSLKQIPIVPLADSKQDSLAKAKYSLETLNRKVIYLTFDDGPNKGTPRVACALKGQKIPATFFMVGSHVQGSEQQWSDFQDLLCDPYFEVANHSYHHAKNNYRRYYKSPELVLEDFQLVRDKIQLNNKLARTPGRNVWRTSEITFDINRHSIKAADLLKAHDYTVVGWDVEWRVNSKKRLNKSAKELVTEIEQYFEERLTRTENHLVLLMHDQHFTDAQHIEELEILLAELINTGEYTFRKVSEYPCL